MTFFDDEISKLSSLFELTSIVVDPLFASFDFLQTLKISSSLLISDLLNELVEIEFVIDSSSNVPFPV